MVAREFTREDFIAGVFSQVFFFRPVEPLARGDYELSVRYAEGFGIEHDPVRFEVVSDVDRSEVTVSARWDRIDFDQMAGTTCGTYFDLLYLTLESDARGDDPLWVRIDVTGRSPPGYEAYPSERTLLVQTESSGATGSMPIRVEALFDAECVTVTPVSLDGEAGEPFTSCQPERCLSLSGAEHDPLEFDLDWSAARPCPKTELELEEGGCGCTGAGDSTPIAWILPFLLMLRGLTGRAVWNKRPPWPTRRRSTGSTSPSRR
jgi:hypothetical protein